MDLNFTKADQEFRNEVREFIAENFSSENNAGQNIEKYHEVTSDQMKEGILSWHKTLYKKGWIAPHWPVEYGGVDWSITQRYIWDQECANAGTTPLIPFGLTMLGPVIIAFGNDHQKDWVLKGICQAMTGGAKVILNQVQDLTLQVLEQKLKEMVIIML